MLALFISVDKVFSLRRLKNYVPKRIKYDAVMESPRQRSMFAPYIDEYNTHSHLKF